MNIIPITNKNQLNSLQSQNNMAQFLQSWEWGEFQEKHGRKVFRFGIEEKGKLASAITAIKHNLPFGKSYLYCPRITTEGGQTFARLQRELEKIAKQENSIFIKLEPAKQSSISNHQSSITKHVQPPTTLLVDLTKSEDELLKNMHSKTRYNIRLAEKKGVKIKESDNIEEFLKLNAETTTRDKFKSHSDDYYRKMSKILKNHKSEITNQKCSAKLFTAYYQDKPLTSNLTIFFGDTVTYLHGASSSEHRNVMAPNLLQWEIIKQAKEMGYKWYDFWGVNPSPDKNLPHHFKKSWEGFSRFKRGFVSKETGKEINFPDCFDLPTSRFWYTLYKAVKKFKK